MLGNVNIRGFSGTGAAIPALVPGEDLVFAHLIDASSGIGPYTDWTQIGTEITLPGGFFVAAFYRKWQSGDVMPTWGVAGAMTLGIYNIDLTDLWQAIDLSLYTAANPTLTSINSGKVIGDMSVYMAQGNSTLSYTPPANWVELFDSANDQSMGYRRDLAPDTAFAPQLTAAASDKGILHVIMKTNNPRQFIFGA